MEIKKRLAARYGAAGAISENNMIVMRGQRGATVYGCRKILFYSPCEIRLDVGKKAVSVVGERLYCSSFSAGTVTVQGCVTGVSYLNAEKND